MLPLERCVRLAWRLSLFLQVAVMSAISTGCPSQSQRSECVTLDQILAIADNPYSPKLSEAGFRVTEWSSQTNQIGAAQGSYLSTFWIWRREGVPVYFVTQSAWLPERYLCVVYLAGVVVSVPEYNEYLKQHRVDVPQELRDGPKGEWITRVRPDWERIDDKGTGHIQIARHEYGPNDVRAYRRMDFELGVLRRLMLGARYMPPQGAAVDSLRQWFPRTLTDDGAGLAK